MAAKKQLIWGALGPKVQCHRHEGVAGPAVGEWGELSLHRGPAERCCPPGGFTPWEWCCCPVRVSLVGLRAQISVPAPGGAQREENAEPWPRDWMGFKVLATRPFWGPMSC